jgi:hypothetical protein
MNALLRELLLVLIIAHKTLLMLDSIYVKPRGIKEASVTSQILKILKNDTHMKSWHSSICICIKLIILSAIHLSFVCLSISKVSLKFTKQREKFDNFKSGFKI